MTADRQLRDRVLDLRIVQILLMHLGVDVCQYRLLLGLFEVLGDRLEFMGRSMQLPKVAGIYAAFSGLISLVVFMRPALQNYLLGMLAYSMFYLVWVLLEDTTNSLLNPEEASVLAHQPIAGATYVAAKLTHILSLLAVFVPALSGIPALAGIYLEGSRWFYPLTHLLAAYVAGLFTAFLICGIYGWLFRLVAPARLKSAALWLQLLVVISPWILQRAAMAMEVESGRFIGKIATSPWLPPRWFAAIGLLGQAHDARFSAWQGGIAILITIGLIAFGMRSFRQDFLVKASSLIQGSASAEHRSKRDSRLGRIVCRITGAPSGYGAFAFTKTLLLRDWNFRRQGLPNMIMMLTALPIVIAAGFETSPFALSVATRRSFSSMHFLPHCLGLIAAVPCSLLAYTAEPRGSWIFTILPMGRLQPFVRGIYLSLWIPIVGIPHLCLLGPCIWFWGVSQAVLFILYSAAVVSFYLSLALFLVEGLPFIEAFVPQKTTSLQLGTLGGLACAVVLGGIQWVLFHSMWLVLGATLVFVLLAHVVGRAGRFRLERKIASDVQRLSFAPQRIFKDLESSG